LHLLRELLLRLLDVGANLLRPAVHLIPIGKDIRRRWSIALLLAEYLPVPAIEFLAGGARRLDEFAVPGIAVPMHLRRYGCGRKKDKEKCAEQYLYDHKKEKGRRKRLPQI
jgi:hypothetical protein